MARSKVPHTLQGQCYLLVSVLGVFPMRGLVAQIKPSRHAFLIEFRVRRRSREFRVDQVGLLWRSSTLDNGYPVLWGKLPEMFFKHRAYKDRSSVFVPLLKQIVGHVEEVGEDVSVHYLDDRLQISRYVVRSKRPQYANKGLQGSIKLPASKIGVAGSALYAAAIGRREPVNSG